MIITARSKFEYKILDKKGQCSGCGKVIKAGESVYIKTYVNRHNRQQRGRNILCNLESCWESWDWSIYNDYKDEK